MKNQKKTATARKTRLGKKTQSRNVSVRQIVSKVADIVKNAVGVKPAEDGEKEEKKKPVRKPFGGKGGRKKKPTEAERRAQIAEKHIAELERQDELCSEMSGSSGDPARNFFYTDEKFITRFEDEEIVECLKRLRPDFDPE